MLLVCVGVHAKATLNLMQWNTWKNLICSDFNDIVIYCWASELHSGTAGTSAKKKHPVLLDWLGHRFLFIYSTQDVDVSGVSVLFQIISQNIDTVSYIFGFFSGGSFIDLYSIVDLKLDQQSVFHCNLRYIQQFTKFRAWSCYL